VECGARTCYGAERGRVPEPRCVPCDYARRAAIAADRREFIEWLWARGCTVREICAELGIIYHKSYLAQWRARGVNLPYRRTPDQVARLIAGNRGQFARARAARKRAA